MEELPFDPDLDSLEEMIMDQQWSDSSGGWQEPFLEEDTDDEDNELMFIPQVPNGYRPAA